MRAMRTRQAGFTLVEMLVVITIIGMLMALLLPAINSAREAARQAVCTSNQQNIAKAMQAYATSKNRLPPSMSLAPFEPAVNVAGFSRARVWGWVPPLLEELGHGDVYNRMLDELDPIKDAETSIVYEELFKSLYYPEFNCPSITRANLDQPWLSYYVNGGRPNVMVSQFGGVDPPFTDLGVAAENDLLPPDWRENGAVMMRIQVQRPTDPRPVTINSRTNALDTIAQGDGTSMTIYLAENCNPRFGDEGNTWSNTIIDDTGNVVIVPPQEHHNAILWQPGGFTDDEGFVGINQHKDDPLNIAHARPASFHPGIVIITFCDGHTQKISETIDYGVYELLMTSNGRNGRNPVDGDPDPPHSQTRLVSEADLAP